MESNIPIANEINVQEANQESQETEIEYIVCGLSVSSSSESLELLSIVHQVSSGVSIYWVFGVLS